MKRKTHSVVVAEAALHTAQGIEQTRTWLKAQREAHPEQAATLDPILLQLDRDLSLAYLNLHVITERLKPKATGAKLAAKADRPAARKQPTAEKLQAFFQTLPDWDDTNPRPRGCIKAAAAHFGVSEKTINRALKQ
jgi:hypothetical protein